MSLHNEEQQQTLELGTRGKIYRLIKRSPGLHFREIQRRTKFAIGNLQYQLSVLEKTRLIKQVKVGKFARYYSIIGQPLEIDSNVLSLLRQDSLRKIALFLLTEKKGTNLSIASAIQLSPSTTSWHLTKMVQAGIVEKKSRGKKRNFYLTNPEQVTKLLVDYKKSFLDELVTSFADTWTQLSIAEQ